MDFAKDIYKNFTNTPQKLGNLSGDVKKLFDQRKGKEVSNYYNLTDLCNPQDAYWERNFPNLEKSRKLELVLRRGTRLGNFARKWFKLLPEFYDSEVTLDGYDIGVPGVIGRIDFKIGDSIVEFKTKSKIPENKEDVISKFPQDLEQLAFYSIMDKDEPKINYLVFMEDAGGNNIIVFKIKTKNPKLIKKILEERKGLLDSALESNDPTRLGKCRYFNYLCAANENKLCRCGDLEPLPTDELIEATEIEIDEDMTRKLIECREASGISEELFYPNEIINPRKSFMRRKLDIEDDYIDNEIRNDRKDRLGSAIRKLESIPEIEEVMEFENSLKEEKLYLPKKWIRLKSSKHQEGIVIPYTVRVGIYDNEVLPNRPSQYDIAELAIICASHNIPKGIIFKIYPNLNDSIQAFEVSFRNLNEIMRKIRDIIRNIESMKDLDEIHKLPPCQFYINKKHDCSITEKCNSEKSEGCLFNYKSNCR